MWFGGNVTGSALFSFGLMVLSSVVAAWADIQHALYGSAEVQSVEAAAAISTLNAGYAWMGMNVFCTAAYVLSMRKVIKKMNFKDWDSEFSICISATTRLTLSSHVLQQPLDHPSSLRLLFHLRELEQDQHPKELPS